MDSIAFEGVEILGLGNRSDVEPLCPHPTRIVDLQGRTVLPAFSDNLARVRKTALARDWIDLSNKTNITEVFAEVEKECLLKPAGTWVRGYGWNMSQWGWHRLPHRADLDLVAPHHPVILYSGDFRIVWLNTAAILESGITHSKSHPLDDQIERDEVTGSATGIFKETAADFLEQKIPEVEPSKLYAGVLDVIQQYISMGVTRLESFGDSEEFGILRELNDQGELPIDIVVHLPYSERSTCIENEWYTGKSFGTLSIGGLWVAVDGTLVSQTARLLEPYGDDWDRFGVELTDQVEIEQAVDFCTKHRFSPVFIASGDAACRTVLRSLKSSERTPTLENRPQLVHGLLVQPEDLDLVENLNLTLTVNPCRISTDKEVGEAYLGTRWNEIIDLGGWRHSGAKIQFGSGEPLAQWSPLKAFSAATSTETGRSSRCVLTRRDGVVALTSSEEYQDNKVGGWVILSDDLERSPRENLKDVHVVATIFNGRVIFESTGLTG